MSNSVNNRLFLEPYGGGKKLELEIKKGFGTVKARSTLIGLKLVRDAQCDYTLAYCLGTCDFPKAVFAANSPKIGKETEAIARH